MRSIIIRGMLAVTVALTAACSSADSVAPAATHASVHSLVSANAEDRTATLWQSVDQYVWLSCANGGAGETVRITGDLRYALHPTRDSAGVSHLNIKSNTSGLTGVGLTSGVVFRGMMAEHVNSRGDDAMNEDVRTTDIIRLVAPGGGDSYALMVSSHFIMDQGTYVLWEETWKEVCR